MRVQSVVVSVLLLSFALPISSVAAKSVGKNCTKAGARAGTTAKPILDAMTNNVSDSFWFVAMTYKH